MSPTTRFGVLAVATFIAVIYAPSCGGDDSTSAATSAGSSTASGSGGTSSTTSSPTSSTGGSAGSGGSSTAATGGGAGGSGGTASSTGGSGGAGGATSGGGGGAGGSGGTGGSGGSAGSGGSGGSGGGAKDGGAGSGGGSPDAGGMFTFTGDFAMMGNRLCFKNGQTRLTGQKSPKLDWSGVPAGTTHLVVTLRDMTNMNVHWVACNIPTSATGLPAGLPGASSMLPSGTQQSSDWYGPGAGPPAHQYQYKLWAMKSASTMCNGLAQGPRNTLWTNLGNDEKGAKSLVLETREIIAYGDQSANCM